MIVRMKKLSLLLYHKEKDAFLKSLQDLGVVHIVENPEKDQASLQEAEIRIQRCEHVLARLHRIAAGTIAQLSDREAQAVIDDFERLEAEENSLEHALQLALKEETILQPWGDFDPETVKKIRAAGVSVRFYKAAPGRFEGIDREGCVIEPVAVRRDGVYFMLLAPEEPPRIDAEELILPGQSLSMVRRRIADLKAQRAVVAAVLEKLAAYTDVTAAFLTAQKNKFQFLSAMLDLDPCVDGKIISITGWFPAAEEKRIADFLKPGAAWFRCDDPSPADTVPVLLENGRFAKLFEPITKLFSLPDYNEYDPTPFFAPFFALYVGLCIGDVGYGCIIALAALLVFKRKSTPRQKPYFRMILMFGCTTMLGGMLLNTCFGSTLFGGPGVPAGTAFLPWGADYFAPLSPQRGEQGALFPMMNFALLLGFLQVVLALVLRMVNRMKTRGFLFGLQPLAYILCIFGALVWGGHVNFLKLDIAAFTVGPARIGALLMMLPPVAGKGLVWCGIIMIFLFNNPDKKLVVRLPLGIWELYGFATGILGDILSYLRLFALGLSSGLLGASFNKLAFMLVTHEGVINYVSPLIIVSIGLLVVGHILNLILSIVGAFVHPLRLTFVEFYKNLDFKGGGKPYLPFAKTQ